MIGTHLVVIKDSVWCDIRIFRETSRHHLCIGRDVVLCDEVRIQTVEVEGHNSVMLTSDRLHRCTDDLSVFLTTILLEGSRCPSHAGGDR